jgi:chemotaxis protein methyltransferase CheR
LSGVLALDDRTFQAFAELIHSSVGIAFTPSKKALVASRLANRLQKLGLEGYPDYLALISSGANDIEFQVALDLLTTNETYFFREPAHYALLERELVGRKHAPLALWSAASSYGDEAYSTAMLLADLQLRGSIGAEWSILGTDISDRVLRSASQAIYPEDRLRDVSPERLRRYCLRGDGEQRGLVQMSAELRERVRFGWLNLCRPIEDVGPFDVVFLRNVLIYFDTPTKIEVVDRVLTQLRPGGVLFLGTAEGRVACKTPLSVLAPGAFRKVAA